MYARGEKAIARRCILDHPWIGLQARDSNCQENTEGLNCAKVRVASYVSLVAGPSRRASRIGTTYAIETRSTAHHFLRGFTSLG